MVDSRKLRKKFLGSLLGAALGDAIGEAIGNLGGGLIGATEDETGSLVGVLPLLRYTDDTHMTIGVAESLITCGGFEGPHMAERFISNYSQEPWRGYAPGPPQVFRRIKSGEPWNRAAAHIYPGGSFGNGAAMRVAPVGLFFWDRPAELVEKAYQQSRITHCHVLGTEGAILQAMSVALAVAENQNEPLDTQSFISQLSGFATEDVYRTKIAKFDTLLKNPGDRRAVVNQLGHGVEAFNSVPTAIFTFLANPQSFASAVTYAVSLGGDTDTIASMAGAISGAYLGSDAIPAGWLRQLENRDYISSLAGKLWQVASGKMSNSEE